MTALPRKPLTASGEVFVNGSLADGIKRWGRGYTTLDVMLAVEGEALTHAEQRTRDLLDAVGRLLGVAGAIARANAVGNLDPKHPFFWPDLDAALIQLREARAAIEEETK